MDRNILKRIYEKREIFIPFVFTQKQMDTIGKYLSDSLLSQAEKKSLYTSISKKSLAISSVSEEYYIRGIEQIIPERLDAAKEMLKDYRNAFISGSFLFSKHYNDIDIFIIGRRSVELHKDNKHFIHITEKRLAEAVIQSSAIISVSNFNNFRKYRGKNIQLYQLMSLYHEAAIEFLQDDKKRENLRELVFRYNLSKGRLINSLELKKLVLSADIDGIDFMFSYMCSELYSKGYLYIKVRDYIKDLDKAINSTTNNNHLQHYKKTYEAIIYGDRKGKAET